jgi:site-specific recombinase XerD
MKLNCLASHLYAFFHEWMGQQKNLSHHTVWSYRDTWKLLLQFTAKRKRRNVAGLSLADLQASDVLAFLDHLEKDRKVSIGTRNCRLAAIHSFFAFVAHREPLAIRQCAEIARIPVKKMSQRAMSYMDAEEIAAVLREPDRSSMEGQRITRCSPSCTTREPESRKRWMCAPGPSASNPLLMSSCLARGAKLVSVRYGRKRSTCSKRF